MLASRVCHPGGHYRHYWGITLSFSEVSATTQIRSDVIPDLQMSCSNYTLRWRHDEHHGASNHRRLDCLLKRLFRRRSKKTSNFYVAGLCEGNPPVTSGFSSERASNAKNVSIWWRHHDRNGMLPGVWSRQWLPGIMYRSDCCWTLLWIQSVNYLELSSLLFCMLLCDFNNEVPL